MNCLIDYIGLEGCSAGSTPVSGVYVNSLPGMELKMVDYIANEEQVNFSGVWTDIQAQAARRFRSDVKAEFNKRYRIKTINQAFDFGREINTASTTAAAAEWRGYTLELNEQGAQFVGSNMQAYYVQTLPLYLPGTINTTVKIFDLDTQTLLKTVSVTGVSGWNTVQVNETYTARRFFVAYDATLVNSVELQMNGYINSYSPGTNYSYWYYDCGCGCIAKIRGAKAPLADPYTITYGENTFGLSSISGVKCQYDAIVCNNKETFTNAWLYCLGSTTMDFRLYTPRLNEYTVFDRDKAQELKMLYEAQYRGGTVNEINYPGELFQAIDGINLDMSDCCIECNAPIRFMDAYL